MKAKVEFKLYEAVDMILAELLEGDLVKTDLVKDIKLEVNEDKPLDSKLSFLVELVPKAEITGITKYDLMEELIKIFRGVK